MSSETAVDAPPGNIPRRLFAVIGLVLVLVTFAVHHEYAYYDLQFGGDQSIICAGTIGLLRGERLRLYNYPEQMGYFELLRLIWKLTPGDSYERVRDISVAVSVVSASLIVLLGLLAFPQELSRRARIWRGLFLAVSPLFWRLSQYGNTALPSSMLVTFAFVCASRLPGWKGASAAAVALAGAMFVRSDAVLASLGMAWYVWRRPGGNFQQGVSIITAAIGVIVIASWQRVVMSAHSAGVMDVIFNRELPGNYLTWMYWGLCPTALLFGAIGWPRLASRPVLAGSLALVAVPALLFYAPWGTTPRYCAKLVGPLSIVCALGVETIIAASRRIVLPLRVAVLTLTFAIIPAHLVFTLQGALAGDFQDWIKPKYYPAGDGPHAYGAWLFEKREMLGNGICNDDAARAFTQALAETGDRQEEWYIIQDYWDDIYTNAFYAACDRGRRLDEQSGVFKSGNVTIRNVMRGEVTKDPGVVYEPMRKGARVFRCGRGDPANDSVLTRLRNYGGGGLLDHHPVGHSRLIEVVRRNPDTRDNTSKPASRPTSQPAPGQASRPDHR